MTQHADKNHTLTRENAQSETKLRLAPVANVSVPDDGPASVSAKFSVGDYQLSGSFRVEETGGRWFVTNPFVRDDTSWAAPELRITLNGLPIDGRQTPSVDLLPGGYQFDTTHPMLIVDPHVLRLAPVASVDFTPMDHFSIHWVGLTASAKTTVAGFMVASLTACLAERAIRLSCGIDADKAGLKLADAPLTSDRTVLASAIDPKTIKWSIEWDKPQPGTTDMDGPMGPTKDWYAVAQVNAALQFHAQTRDGQDVVAFTSLARVGADITDPDHLKLVIAEVNPAPR